MSRDDLNERATLSGDQDRPEPDHESAQRSGATAIFWILVVLLTCLGLCVLVSVVLAIANGP